jgi:hypothetical protein
VPYIGFAEAWCAITRGEGLRLHRHPELPGDRVAGDDGERCEQVRVIVLRRGRRGNAENTTHERSSKKLVPHAALSFVYVVCVICGLSRQWIE